MDLLKYYLAKLNQDGRSDKMDLKMYCSMYMEFLKLFIHLGKAIKFAFSGEFHFVQLILIKKILTNFSSFNIDIHEKATAMMKN